MGGKTISHKGIVRSVDGRETVVEIVAAAACASCHARGLCTASESARKEIRVPSDGSVSVGDEVSVILSESLGMRAVALAYVLPLFVLLILIVSLSFTDMREPLIALAGLSGMAAYYFFLYLFRGRIGKEYVFSIRKQQHKPFE